uniref:Uncharacterized protein n=1 Tax=Rhizophora mucronata TaxID=61149 RepID=A0A2P2JBG4_RHIMU
MFYYCCCSYGICKQVSWQKKRLEKGNVFRTQMLLCEMHYKGPFFIC